MPTSAASPLPNPSWTKQAAELYATAAAPVHSPIEAVQGAASPLRSIAAADSQSFLDIMARPSSSFNCITLTLLILPAIVLTVYLLTSFPHVPESLVVHPSLSSLVAPNAHGNDDDIARKVKAIYPEDFWMMDNGVKAQAGYAVLPQGRTRYWIIGPEDGKKVVLIHGLSIPSIIWKDVAPELAQKGYRVLLYDLYGRGYSDAPQVTYGTSLYVTQLALLLQYVGWEKTNVVGISMGGAIAASFCVQFPHLVTGKVALFAAAGILEAEDMSRTSRFLSSPLMQAVTATYPFRVYLKRLANTSMPASGRDDSFSELVRIQSAHLPGYNSALASSIRDGPIRNLAPVYAQLGRVTKKIFKEFGTNEGELLLVWGTRDRVVPYHYAARVLALLGGSPASMSTYSSPNPDVHHSSDASTLTNKEHVRLVTIDGAGHDLTASHPTLIVQLLLEFFAHV
ncbi:alpha/beta-hydrolase [Trametopsis cervina]|nr:alpha/beta-hydrolase [Trametopsis cervina]